MPIHRGAKGGFPHQGVLIILLRLLLTWDSKPKTSLTLLMLSCFIHWKQTFCLCVKLFNCCFACTDYCFLSEPSFTFSLFNGEHAKKKKKNTEAEIDLTYTCGVINSVVIVDSKYDEMRKLF